MNKSEFMKALVQRVNSLPQAEIDKSLGYYDEIISDRMEDGMSEEEAIAALGSIDDIAAEILAAAPQGSAQSPRSTAKPAAAANSGQYNWLLWAAILVLGFPIWFPVLITALSIIFSVVVTVAAVYGSLWVSAVSVIAAAIYVLITESVGAGLCWLGCGLFLTGLCLLITRPIVRFCKWSCHWTVIGCKKLFHLVVPDKAPQQPAAKEVL